MSRLPTTAADAGAGELRCIELTSFDAVGVVWNPLVRLPCRVNRQRAVVPPHVPLLVSSVIYFDFLVSRRHQHRSAHMPDSNQCSSHAAPPLSNAKEDAFVHTALQLLFAFACWFPSHHISIFFCKASNDLGGSHPHEGCFPLLPRQLRLSTFPTRRRVLPGQRRPRFSGGLGKPSSSRRRST